MMMTKTSERVDMWLLRRIYGLLLTLYPREYLGEYGDELQTVFNLSLDEATGRFEVILIFVRELAGLPKAIISEHLRERRKVKMTGKFASRLDFAPGSGSEVFAALAPFLFGMVMLFFGYIGRYLTFPMWAQTAFVVLFWSSILGMFLLGSAKGLPRWFLPYLGMLFEIASLLLLSILVDLRVDVWWHRSSGFGNDFNFGNFLWIGLILMVFLLLVISRSVLRFRPFYQRLRDDWTLLSFLLYGTVPLMLWLSFDGYVNEEPVFALSLLILGLGGWFYLRSDAPMKRFASLHIGLALSMLTATAGKAVLIIGSQSQVFDFILKDELLFTLETWLWLALIMLLPLLLNLLPRSEEKPKTA